MSGHSLTHRANTLLTSFASVAAVLAALTSLTDVVHRSNPTVTASVAEVKRLALYNKVKDQVVLTLNVEADLRSVFSWNTKQLFVYVQAEYVTPQNKLNHVVLWDSIIQSKDQAVIKLRRHKPKYAFFDIGKGLRGTPINITVTWNVMPRVGYLYKQSRTFPAGGLPGAYT